MLFPISNQQQHWSYFALAVPLSREYGEFKAENHNISRPLLLNAFARDDTDGRIGGHADSWTCRPWLFYSALQRYAVMQTCCKNTQY